MMRYPKQILLLAALSLLFSCKSKDKELETINNIQLEKSLLKVEVLAKNLDVPWDICYADDNSIFIAEQSGIVSKIDLETGIQKQLLRIPEVWRKRTSGLLGLVVHPEVRKNPYLFVNFTVKKDSSTIINRLVRYEITADTLVHAKILLEVDGFTAHNGSRLAIGKDGKLYWATGDAYVSANAQNLNSLNGKILRMNVDGSVPKDNPFPNSYVWAAGFRNMQGLAFSSSGKLYTSEHGDAIEDEINLIEKGKNYGWPAIEGVEDLDEEKSFAIQYRTSPPIRSWTPVIAPAGIAYYGSATIGEWTNSLLLTTLKGKSLRVIKLAVDGRKTVNEEIFFENYYGRLRDVCVDNNGAIYLATSNRDWNPSPGFPLPEDDKILKISLAENATHQILKGSKPLVSAQVSGKNLYQQYCASCHKDDGSGVLNTFPALAGSATVKGSLPKLSSILLKGINKKNAGANMPAFGFLKDDEVAAVLTYIRQNWGNKAGSVSPSQIKALR